MWEGIIAGVIIFIVCESLRLGIKKLLPKAKSRIAKYRSRRYGFGIGPEFDEIEKIPEEKRTKKQQRFYLKWKDTALIKYGH